ARRRRRLSARVPTFVRSARRATVRRLARPVATRAGLLRATLRHAPTTRRAAERTPRGSQGPNRRRQWPRRRRRRAPTARPRGRRRRERLPPEREAPRPVPRRSTAIETRLETRRRV